MSARSKLLRQFEDIANGLLADIDDAHRGELERLLFSKRIFQTPNGNPPVPDGRSLEYLEIAESLWMADPVPSQGAGASLGAIIHEELRLAHLRERRLLEHLEAEGAL